jgi:hypothetical protein
MTDQTLKIEVGSIVSGLMPAESVEITKIQALGLEYSLSYTGVNTHRAGSILLYFSTI